MRDRRRSRRLAIAVSVACALLQVPSARPSSSDAQDFARIDRGRYLATLGDCASCHADPERKDTLAGGRPIRTPFGVVLAANITPDRDTGIGAWSDDQFDAALRRGRRPDGRLLYPAMPFPYYTKMTREDVLAIRAYLNTVTPVHKDVRSNRLPFPFNLRAVMHVWDALYFEAGSFTPDQAKSAPVNRGAYLVQGPGHCGACHTPKSFLGGDVRRKALQGYSLQGWFAPDITDDAAAGLGRWSEADIVDYLENGHNRLAGASGPMAEEVEYSSSKFSQADLSAIATYLKSLPGHAAGATAVAARAPVMKAGAAIYQDLCSACHAPDGSGVAYLIPDLARAPSVVSRESTSLLRVVIDGAQSAATKAEPTAPQMPAFGWQLTDAQIAAVITYVRNSWGHAGSAVSSDDVHRARKQFFGTDHH